MNENEIMSNEMEIQETENPEIIPAEEAEGSGFTTSAVAGIALVAVGVGAGVMALVQNVIVPGVKKANVKLKKIADELTLRREEKRAQKQRKKDIDDEFNDEPIEGVEPLDE